MPDKHKPVLTPVSKATGGIPSDAILLTEGDALDLQWKILSRWQPRRDVWPFTVGIGALGATAGLSGYVANRHYRKRLNLLTYGRAASYFPVVLLPVVLSSFLHHQLVSRDILLYKKVCPICMQTRAMALQIACGIVYPMLIAPAATFHLASRVYTYPIPPISKELLRTYTQLTKPLVPFLMLLAACNIGMAMFVSFSEVESIHKINRKMLEYHEQFEAKKKLKQ